MRKQLFAWLGMVALVSLLGAACAPSVSPAPTQPQAAAPATPAPAPSAAPAPAPEDAAWDKVVSAAKKEGKVVIYTFTFAGDTGVKTAQAFKEKYGITVEFITGRSPAIVERLRTEYRANQLVADLAEGAGARMALLKEWGFTDSLKEIPVLRQKDIWKGNITLYDSEEAHILVYLPSPTTVISNTRLVQPNDEPKSWYDLLDAKWKGKILTQDPAQGLETTVWYVGMTNHKALPPDYFDKFALQGLLFTIGGPADTVRALARGERHLAVPASAVGAIPVIQEGGPIKLLTMKEGFGVSTLPFANLKNSPHPNAAKVFMNWLLSTEGMSTFVPVAKTYSFRKDVPDAIPANAQVDWSKAIFPTKQDELDQTKLWNAQHMIKVLKKTN